VLVLNILSGHHLQKGTRHGEPQGKSCVGDIVFHRVTAQSQHMHASAAHRHAARKHTRRVMCVTQRRSTIQGTGTERRIASQHSKCSSLTTPVKAPCYSCP
jgi:hypothetical protein